MAKKDPRKDPSTTSAAYNSMAPMWAKVQTILDGTEEMRAAGQTYTPQHEFEPDQAYLDRLDGTFLFNASKQTLDSWVGRPFSDPIKVEKDVPQEIEDLFDNVDLQGNALSVFSRTWYRWGLAKALCHVLVDHPDPFENPDDAPQTKADDKNLRPYFSMVEPENLIFASARVVDSREILTHVRIMETETIRDGFSETTVERIRVFDRALPDEVNTEEAVGVFVTLWELTKDPKTKKTEWRPVPGKENVRLDIDEIPLVTFYADRTGLMTGVSPLEDLVDLNIRHWQSTSNQNVTLDVARFPILGASGLTEAERKKKIVVGPKKVLKTSKENGKFYYIEHTGAAIKAGQDELEKLEEKMATYGADFLRKRTGGITATARALDSAEATSPLQDATSRFNDALNQAIALLGKWLDIEDAGTVTVSTEFGPEEVVQGDLQALGQARTNRDISRKTYTEELKRRSVLADTFDTKADAAELKKEMDDEMRTEIEIDDQAEE